MARAKLIAALVLVVAALTIVLQNTQAVETKILFVTLTMPRAALLAITMLIGIGIGMLVALGLSGKKTK
jgi:hypothetical protein